MWPSVLYNVKKKVKGDKLYETCCISRFIIPVYTKCLSRFKVMDYDSLHHEALVLYANHVCPESHSFARHWHKCHSFNFHFQTLPTGIYGRPVIQSKFIVPPILLKGGPRNGVITCCSTETTRVDRVDNNWMTTVVAAWIGHKMWEGTFSFHQPQWDWASTSHIWIIRL